MDELNTETDPLISVEITADTSGTATVTIAGELDIGSIEALDAKVTPVLATGPERLIVDVGGLRFADSSAIALWVRWAAKVRTFELRNPTPLLRRVVTMMGLASVLKLDP